MLRLVLLSPQIVALRRAEVYPREALVRAAIATGTSYTGIVRSVSGVESVSLSFQHKDETRDVIATVGCAGRRAQFAVELVLRPNGKEACDVLLLPARTGPGLKGPGAKASALDLWGPVKLSLQGGGLEGWTDVSGESAAVRLRRKHLTR